jgi:hypothetical protein
MAGSVVMSTVLRFELNTLHTQISYSLATGLPLIHWCKFDILWKLIIYSFSYKMSKFCTKWDPNRNKSVYNFQGLIILF